MKAYGYQVFLLCLPKVFWRYGWPQLDSHGVDLLEDVNQQSLERLKDNTTAWLHFEHHEDPPSLYVQETLGREGDGSTVTLCGNSGTVGRLF